MLSGKIYLVTKLIFVVINSNFVYCHTTGAGNVHTRDTLSLSENETAVRKGSGIIGAFVFPHGGITVAPEFRDFSQEAASEKKTKDESLKLNTAMKKAAKELVRRKPDLIIFSTPHGLWLQNHLLVMGNKHVEGSFENGKYSTSFDLDVHSAGVIYKSLLNLSNSVEFLTLGIGEDTLPIGWAEVIPWMFIKEAADNENFKLPPVVLIGVQPEKNISHFLKLGNDIFSVIEKNSVLSQKRIAYVVSGDLSHYHSHDPSSPYPFNQASSIFDNYIVQWAKMDRTMETEEESTKILIHQAGDAAKSAGSCGFNGLVILHGVLSQGVTSGCEYHSKFYEYRAPSYFGMMVASWLP